jgi:hypothetical protein
MIYQQIFLALQLPYQGWKHNVRKSFRNQSEINLREAEGSCRTDLPQTNVPESGEFIDATQFRFQAETRGLGISSSAGAGHLLDPRYSLGGQAD